VAQGKPRGGKPTASTKKTSSKKNTQKKIAKPYAYQSERAGITPSSLYAQPVETKEPLTLCIERLADDGRGIAVDQGKTTFVAGALDGETVLATIIKRNHTFNEGRVKTIISPSSDRIQPPCPVFTRCGGCSVQYMPSAKQLAFKQAAVLSQLSRWANIRPQQLLPTISVKEYGYRQRVRLAVDYAKDGELFLGFREEASRRLVNITECAVLEPALQAVLPVLRQWLGTIKAQRVGHIELVNTEAMVTIVVRHTRAVSDDSRKQLATLLADAELTTAVYFQGAKNATLENVAGEGVDPRLEYALVLQQPLALRFHPQDFIQSNLEVNQAMVAQALDLLAPQPTEHIVDLFCGIGNFSLAIAQQAKHVTGIEGIDAMVGRARDNARYNQLNNLTFMVQDLSDASFDASKITKNVHFSTPLAVDGVVLDPPRSGAKEICQNIRKLLPKRIVYVSCDSSTFARDAKILVENGYSLSHLGVMDMFPQTAHVELMALFVLTGKKPKTSTKKAGQRRSRVGLKF
jgi:23S rRNA (uracil1939-C5)-methyltransferase